MLSATSIRCIVTARNSRTNLIRLLCYISFGMLYTQVVFLSDCATYTHASFENTVNIGDAPDSMKALRSFPHLRAINTLRHYEYQTKNKKSFNSTQKKGDGTDELLQKEQNSTILNHNNSKLSSHWKDQATKDKDHTSTMTMSSVMGAVMGLLLFSIFCRCLIAGLVYRQHNQISESGVDSRGHIQVWRRDRPLEERISFWQAFRTMQRRNRGRLSRPQINYRSSLLMTNLVNQLNQQRVTNGVRPLSIESAALLFRNNRQNFSGNDYEALWGFQEENGNALSNSPNSISQQGASDQDIARNPVRFLEEGDGLIRIHNVNHSSVNSDLENDAEAEEKRCSICLENFYREEMVRTLPCFHSYHANCIDPWLRSKSTCPICKQDII